MIEVFFSSWRLATPLIFAGMGGLLTEKCGIATLCLEGVLLISAFVSAVAAYFTQNPWMGLFAGILSGSFLMGLHWFFTQRLKIDDIISGIAINLLALGIPPFLSQLFFESTNNTPSVTFSSQFGHPSQLVLLALLLPFFVQPLLNQTVFGLHLRAAGENPKALKSVGGNVDRVRLITCLGSGAIIACGGVYLSLGHSSQFIREMSAGKGFIALAAIIFGKWHPYRVFLACLFFGFTETIPMVLEANPILSKIIPTQWIQVLPYLLTLSILIFVHPKIKVPTWAK